MKSAISQSNGVSQTPTGFMLWCLSSSSAKVFGYVLGLAACPCCGGSWSSRVWAGRRGVKRMQNQDGVLWGFLFSLNLQCWQQCATSVAATYHSHTETRNVPPQLQTILCSVWASLVLCDSNPFRPVLSPCSEGRGSLGNACRACQCFLYCPGLAQELGSCSPPGRRMLKAEEMVLKPSFVNSGTLSKLLLLFNQLPTCDINGYEILAALW